MKKITLLGLAALTVILTGCPRNADNKTDKDDDSEITTNLDESKGTNEVKGTWADNSNKIVLDDNTAALYGNTSSRAAETAATTEQSSYYYSFNSEDKTVEFQLYKMWDSNGAAIEYKAAVDATKAAYKSQKAAFLDAIDKDKNSSYKDVIDNLNTAGGLLGNDTYGDTIDTLIHDKINSFLGSQESVLEDYLEAKYSSVIKLGYTLDVNADPNTLTFKQQFLGDLNDASSEFFSADGTIKLNDYENLYPIFIKDSDFNYIGVPVFNEDQTTVKASLLQEVLSAEDASAVAAEWISEISAKLTDITSLTSILASEAPQDITNTIGEWIDEALHSHDFEATVSVDMENEKVTLTLTKDFGKNYTAGTTIELSHVSVFNTSIEGAELTKQSE